MIIEKDGYTYIPLYIFARLAGITRASAGLYVCTGLIHQTYVIGGSTNINNTANCYVREDKVKDFIYFRKHYKRSVDFRMEVEKRFKIKITDKDLREMYTQGFSDPSWYKFFTGSREDCAAKITIIFFCIDNIKDFVNAYYEYLRVKKIRRQNSSMFAMEDEPSDLTLYKPNENCDGFLLTPDQIERLKTIREYKEGKKPLF